jgi:hypothetical protein
VNVSSIGSNSLSIAGNINVSMGSPTTLFTFTPSNVVAQYTRIAYGAGRFVIIGDTGKVFYSSNGTTWTQVNTPTFTGTMRTVLFAKDRFMIIPEINLTTYTIYTSFDGITWNSVSSGTIKNNLLRAAYGNNVVVAVTPGSLSGSVSTNTTGTAWNPVTFPNPTPIYNVGFGNMVNNTTNGTNVFIVIGANSIRRNQISPPTATNDWVNSATQPGIGEWSYLGFGNDTFMVTSNDTPGRLTISKDGGNNWSTPIHFGITLRYPIYVEGEWYIGSEDGYIMISKNDGLTWDKRRTGTQIYDIAYGNGLLVGVNYNISNTNLTNLIDLKKTRDDGSLITSDSITIGRDGSQIVVRGENFTADLGTTCTAITQTQANNSTKIATTAYVDTGLGFKLNTIGSVSTFNCPILRADASTVSTTQFATVRYTPINSRCAYVSIQFLNISENVRGIRINTTQFPLLIGLSPIPIFTIPVVSLRAGNGTAVDGGLTYQSGNLFLANRNQGIGWYNQQLAGNASDLTFHTSALPNSDGATSLYYTYIDCMQLCGIIGV